MVASFNWGKEIDREVIVRPPKEANTDCLWVLIKCAYGLADAPRCWYLRIREELLKLGARPSKLDNSIFFFGLSELLGLSILYVDDIMWSWEEATVKKLTSSKQPWNGRCLQIHLHTNHARIRHKHQSRSVIVREFHQTNNSGQEPNGKQTCWLIIQRWNNSPPCCSWSTHLVRKYDQTWYFISVPVSRNQLFPTFEGLTKLSHISRTPLLSLPLHH